MRYEIGQYHDPDTDRLRWGVFMTPSRTWTFATRHGRRAAQRLADRLNKEAR